MSKDHPLIDIDKFIQISDLTTREINTRRSEFIQQTVKPEHLKKHLDDGWELVPNKLKSLEKIKKKKHHGEAFEARVWGLFARMGFEHINSDSDFKIKYGDGLSKQIDVIVCDPEVVLVVECKSSEAKRKGTSYKEKIGEFASLKDSIREAIYDVFPDKPSVAFIFATSDIILPDNDKKRLEGFSIHHFNQDVIDYYEQLTDHLGEAAKYQLFGTLFSGQTIRNLSVRVPAIRGKVASGATFYSFSIDPKALLKLGFVLHRSDASEEASKAYQRLVKKGRLAQVSDFIDNGGYFPNSIIINIQTKKLRFEEAEKIEHDSKTTMGVLHLPKSYKSAFIIDGQHRLFGYAKSANDSHHTIPVVAFHNLPDDEQTSIFVDINHSQKSVPANLLQSLMADFHWGSSNERLAIGALKTRLFTVLNADDASPFYHRLVLAEEAKSHTRCLTLKTLKDWGLSSKTNYFGILKGDVLIQDGHLTCKDYDATLKKSKEFFNAIFGKIEDDIGYQWALGSAPEGFIAMNVGVSSTIRIIDDVLEFLVKSKNISPNKLSGKELAEQTFPYLNSVIRFIAKLDSEGIKKLRGILGSGAVNKVVREFQFSIHEDIPEFNPEGLEQWIKDNSGQYNDASYQIGYHQIEPILDVHIKTVLNKLYGEKFWWNKGVPAVVQKQCATARIESPSDEVNDWAFLTPIHYFNIVTDKNNWKEFEKTLAAPGTDNSSKDKKFSWIQEFNLIRQKYSHPQRENISEEEHLFLVDLEKWLSSRLG
ncbi:MAG: DGQHR domain-containing protein [Mariprofundaceae bacterium]|nr:DGQHR domain-containing protein [Mariprofundaceae bacterium]